MFPSNYFQILLVLLLVLESFELRTRMRTRTRRTSSFQIVTRPEMDAVEHAVADFHVLLAEVGA
jgi:hypothetical protein